MDFRGGTYLRQIMQPDLKKAVSTWSVSLDIDQIQFFGESSKSELIKLMKNERPVPIEGMDNVWCISGILKVGFFVVHIIC